MRAVPDCVGLRNPTREREIELIEIVHNNSMHPQSLGVRRDSSEGRFVDLLGKIEEASQVVLARRHSSETGSRLGTSKCEARSGSPGNILMRCLTGRRAAYERSGLDYRQ